ncbi:DUF6348 family protein [Kitasatospora cinereorecta]|uniref:DUF6348 family protein n=1 Tax=Kitasatospora cinereorecta TaxID=285560 RepID=A0ABW0V4T6_9ACTN
MGWGSRLRDAVGVARRSERRAERLPEQVVLTLVAEQLAALSSQDWTVADGLARGPQSIAVRLGAPHPDGPYPDGPHSDDPLHLDLVLLPDADRPDGPAVPDCLVGFGGDEAAVRRGIEVWAATAAVTVLELHAHSGRFAGHVDPRDQDGFPGRHAIHGGIVAWGAGERQNAVQDWMLANPLLPRLAPALDGPVERDELIGLAVHFGSGEGVDAAEVRVDGRRHQAASRVLAGLDWPRVDRGSSYARTFALLTGRAAR